MPLTLNHTGLQWLAIAIAFHAICIVVAGMMRLVEKRQP